MSSLICPKPRRLGDPISHSNCLPLRNQAETFVSKGGAELIDLILKEDGVAAAQYTSDLSSSPPFFSGSPPCRAMNPLIRDAHFTNEKQPRFSSSPRSSTSASSSPSSSCKGRCSRARLGQTQSPNRIEGFDCQNARMAAMA
ncbi:uncharacterized protein LOC107830359 [Nicotiana tabacum]|uniref:Uncharacterized protein LOC107830359 n=2 Tax=Nicotiana TaxID=4085 RepID=A0A1S4DJA9_TOBAC|nr:PREDICTED: uncharacterized protein LOC104227855 [Nicotiana sylvestris]XP_016513374.1 PREDICTED: uncharacterized protein LOC107830359 [Nicotiana tabacum]